MIYIQKLYLMLIFVQGLGENFCGNFNVVVDMVFNDKEGQVRDEVIVSKGEKEVINKEFDYSKGVCKLV